MSPGMIPLKDMLNLKLLVLLLLTKFAKVNFTWSFFEVNQLWSKLISHRPTLHLLEAFLFITVLSSINTNAQGHWLLNAHLKSQVLLWHLTLCSLPKESPFFFPLVFFSLLWLTFLLTSLCSVWLASSLLSLSAGNSILHSAADSVTSAVQKASQALNERGERLGRAEERTADMMNSAEQFAVTAHKVRQYVSKIDYNIT